MTVCTRQFFPGDALQPACFTAAMTICFFILQAALPQLHGLDFSNELLLALRRVSHECLEAWTEPGGHIRTFDSAPLTLPSLERHQFCGEEEAEKYY